MTPTTDINPQMTEPGRISYYVMDKVGKSKGPWVIKEAKDLCKGEIGKKGSWMILEQMCVPSNVKGSKLAPDWKGVICPTGTKCEIGTSAKTGVVAAYCAPIPPPQSPPPQTTCICEEYPDAQNTPTAFGTLKGKWVAAGIETTFEDQDECAGENTVNESTCVSSFPCHDKLPVSCPTGTLCNGGVCLASPPPPPPPPPVKPAITAGVSHTCHLRKDGTVECWGLNNTGQLGNGTTTNSEKATPVQGDDGKPLSEVTTIAAGQHYTCASLNDGSVRCWGENAKNTLGFKDNGANMAVAVTPSVVDIDNVSTVAGGLLHRCARLKDSTVKCWGTNVTGQLGTGPTVSMSEPTPVANLVNATALTAGTGHSCVLKAGVTFDDKNTSNIYCWGANQFGQLGIGGGSESAFFVPPATVAVVTAGEYHTCAIMDGGTVTCWGLGEHGALGSGKTDNRPTPLAVPGLKNIVAIAAGKHHTCVAEQDGPVWCWGFNNAGQLGDGTTDDRTSPVPVTVKNVANAVALAAGSFHTCALFNDDTVKCWGSDSQGQLGE